MENKELLNEERYQKTKRKISLIALIVLILGLSLGGFLIFKGMKSSSPDRINELTKKLENKRTELQSKGITYNAFAKYTDGETYELKLITEVLDPSFEHCNFSEFKNNSITKEYCAEKNKSDDLSKTAYIMFGVFICIATCMISGSIYMIAKRREIIAFGAQQVMPVAQEGIEKMAPTVGNAVGEIAKGIKEGLKDEDSKE